MRAKLKTWLAQLNFELHNSIYDWEMNLSINSARERSVARYRTFEMRLAVTLWGRPIEHRRSLRVHLTISCEITGRR